MIIDKNISSEVRLLPPFLQICKKFIEISYTKVTLFHSLDDFLVRQNKLHFLQKFLAYGLLALGNISIVLSLAKTENLIILCSELNAK